MRDNKINVKIEKARNKKGEYVCIQICLIMCSNTNNIILYDSMIKNNEELICLPKHIKSDTLLSAPSSFTVARQIHQITKGFVIEKNADFERFMRANMM